MVFFLSYSAHPNNNKHLNVQQDNLSAVNLCDNKMSLTLFKTFFFLKAYQNSCQAQRNNKEFTQLRRQQQLLTTMYGALKVTADVLSPILY